MELSLVSQRREQLLDITSQVEAIIHGQDWSRGALVVYCPHTTAALTINEGADPHVARDLVACLGRLIPLRGDYAHAEGNSDAHVKTALVGPSQLLIVEDGRLCLGTWQRLFFCEFDGPRQRQLWLQWLPGA